MKKQIGIIGLGYLGKRLALVIRKDYKVVGLTRSSQFNIDGVHHICMDLDHIDTDHKIWDSHFLILSFPPSGVDNYADIIAKIRNFSQSTIILVSSVSAYSANQGQVDESSSIHGKQSIIDAENNINSISDYILRLGGIAGPNRHPWDYLEGKTKDHDEYLHLVHIDDCVQAIKSILEKKPNKRIFNIVNSQRILKSHFYSKKCKIPPQYGEIRENAKRVSNELSIKELSINYKEL